MQKQVKAGAVIYFEYCFKIILSVAFISISQANAQTPRAVPNPYLSVSNNYVRCWDAVIPQNNTNSITVIANITQCKIATRYFDGLGRPLQVIAKKGSL